MTTPATLEQIAQQLADMVASARREGHGAGYDDGYEDALSLPCPSCGATHELGQQGELTG